MESLSCWSPSPRGQRQHGRRKLYIVVSRKRKTHHHMAVLSKFMPPYILQYRQESYMDLEYVSPPVRHPI